jgi:hypothetical protein
MKKENINRRDEMADKVAWVGGLILIIIYQSSQ